MITGWILASRRAEARPTRGTPDSAVRIPIQKIAHKTNILTIVPIPPDPPFLIGIGSPPGADQIGWVITQILAKQLHYDFICLDRPGPKLLTAMEDYDKVILIDALLGQTPGKVHAINPQHLIRNPDPPSLHDLGVAETLSMGQKLKLLPPDLKIYGIEVPTPVGAKVVELNSTQAPGWINNAAQTLIDLIIQTTQVDFGPES